MNIDGIWEGKLDGTNWGRLLLKLEQHNDSVYGTAQITDVGYGIYILDVEGSIARDEISIKLTPAKLSVYRYPGEINGNGKLVRSDELSGEWKSSKGSYGIFQAKRQSITPFDRAEMAEGIAESNNAFIMMAFGHTGRPSLPDEDVLGAIKRGCNAVSIDSHRADEIEYSGSITETLLKAIRNYRFLISDLTYERPNVYYEIGYAHGLDREVILTAYKDTAIHFDIVNYNVIFYSSATELENRVRSRLRAKLTQEEKIAADTN